MKLESQVQTLSGDSFYTLNTNALKKGMNPHSLQLLAIEAV